MKYWRRTMTEQEVPGDAGYDPKKFNKKLPKELPVVLQSRKMQYAADRLLYTALWKENERLKAELVKVREEKENKEAEYKAQSTLTSCGYCGKTFSKDSEEVKITKHIKSCKKHPLLKANQRIRQLESELEKVQKEKILPSGEVLNG